MNKCIPYGSVKGSSLRFITLAVFSQSKETFPRNSNSSIVKSIFSSYKTRTAHPKVIPNFSSNGL